MTDYYALEARLSAHVSERMLELAGIVPGMCVLDLATGQGEPLVRIARRVGPSGRVVGVDPWVKALEVTRARVSDLANVTLQAVRAEAFDADEATFDAVTCRWGLFACSDPLEVLRRIRRALKPGGLLVAALWAEYERIPWYSLVREVTARFLDLPPRSAELPGPARFGTRELIERDFGAAGLEIVHMEEVDCKVLEAVDLIEWVHYFWGRWVERLTPAQLPAWQEALRGAAEGYRVDGLICLGGVTRLVAARPRLLVSL